MSSDTFQLIYDGPQIQNGEMDVLDLAPALNAVGELFQAADSAMNGSNTVVKTAVKAEFRKGSFEIVLIVEQTLRDAAVGLIPSLHLIGADVLIATVIGKAWDNAKEMAKEKAPELVIGLFKLLSKLGGEKPKEIQYDESNNSSIFVIGNGNRIHVDQRTTELYENRSTLSAATRVASPLMREGISDLKVKKLSCEIATLRRSDFPQFEEPLALSPSSDSSSSGSPEPQELIVRIVKTDFQDGKWSVSDGGKPFTVSIDDEEFKSRVHAREIGFYDGDLYKVQMVTSQKLDGRGISTSRSIVRVVEPVALPKQQNLELPSSTPRIKENTKQAD